MSNARKVFAVAVLLALAWAVAPVVEAQPPIRIGASPGHSPRPASKRLGWALALAEPRGMRPLVAHRHLDLGKLYTRTGEREQAQVHLTTATTMYHEMDVRFWPTQAETSLRDLT